MSHRPSTVIIFGATGFIGKNIVDYLQSRLIQRIITVSHRSAYPESREHYTMDTVMEVKVPEDTVAINVAAYRYDAQKHQNSASENFQHNVDIASFFYHFCASHNIKEVRLASSIAVYESDNLILDDDVPVNKTHFPAKSEVMYGLSKRVTEEIADFYHHVYGINTIAFRLSNPYGPYDSLNVERAHVVAAFIMKALTTEGDFIVKGNMEATRDWIYVKDVCAIFYLSLEKRNIHDVYNLATGTNFSVYSLAQKIIALTDSHRSIKNEGEATSSVVHRTTKVDRLKNLFNYHQFISPEEGLKDTITWYNKTIKRET